MNNKPILTEMKDIRVQINLPLNSMSLEVLSTVERSHRPEIIRSLIRTGGSRSISLDAKGLRSYFDAQDSVRVRINSLEEHLPAINNMGASLRGLYIYLLLEGALFVTNRRPQGNHIPFESALNVDYEFFERPENENDDLESDEYIRGLSDSETSVENH
jgi:hypothetical protein